MNEKFEVGIIGNKYGAKSCMERLVSSMYDYLVFLCIFIWSGISFQAKYLKQHSL